MDHISKLTINRQCEYPKIFHARWVRLAKSSNIEDLTDNNIKNIINDHNKTNDFNTIKQWLHFVVEDESQQHSSNDYKCKKVDTS